MNALGGQPAPPRVAVIGGGFCGAFFAAQLAHHATVPVAISVIEPRPNLGGGVAYSSTDPAHRVNVAAARMTLFADQPCHFDEWLRRNGELDADPEALWPDGHAYPRRAVFGRYVAEILAQRQATSPDIGIAHVRDRALAAIRAGTGYEIALAEGGRLAADIVVLATSHPPPGLPALVAAALTDDPGLIADPWAPDALAGIASDASVLIIGAGLTMADVVASLALRRHTGQITAFSRRGLLPRGHAKTLVQTPCDWFETHEPPTTVAALSRLARQLVAKAVATDLPWQSVFDHIRANGQRIWRGLNEAERRRFLRHLRVFWDAHRYRIAPQAEAVLNRKQRDGSLRVLAASLRAIGRAGDQIEAVIHPRRAAPGVTESFRVDHVVVTTGPDHGAAVQHNPVLRSLARQGLLKADSLALGVAVDAKAQVIKSDGGSTPTLLVVGPLARGQYGELMGMPQVAAQPDAVARFIAASLASQQLPEPLTRHTGHDVKSSASRTAAA